MPTPTYTPLATVTLASVSAAVTFSSIPANYRDLICTVVAPGSTTLQGRIRLNGDTGANYSYVRMSGSGSARTSVAAVSQTLGFLSGIAVATTANALQLSIEVMDYSATDKHKTILSRADQSTSGTEAFANRWANTAAVTSVRILTSTGSWAIGSTFSLYGIAS